MSKLKAIFFIYTYILQYCSNIKRVAQPFQKGSFNVMERLSNPCAYY